MTRNSYRSADVARVYDAKNAARDDFAFYGELAGELSAGRPDFAILDIGCGTGAMAVDLAATGYRVTGVDPAEAMLEVARGRPGGDACSWIHGYADDAPDESADLVVMTGHVAQYFLTAQDWSQVLAQIHRALRPGGRLAFESRNPDHRAWERWTPEHTTRRLPHPDGGEITTWIELLDVDEDSPQGVLETHRGITIYPDGHRSGDDSSETLVFRPFDELVRSMELAGFTLDRAYGDFTRRPITHADSDSGASVEYVVIAHRSVDVAQAAGCPARGR